MLILQTEQILLGVPAPLTLLWLTLCPAEKTHEKPSLKPKLKAKVALKELLMSVITPRNCSTEHSTVK